MTIRKDGGPAFPLQDASSDDSWVGEREGMTLRDYFAAHAMVGLLSAVAADMYGTDPKYRRLADLSYKCADAMLAERSK